MIQSSINQAMSNLGSTIKTFTGLKDRQKQANHKTKMKVEAKKAQRRNFKSYLGNLPQKIKNDISKQFSPYQKRKIMNEVDTKGGKNG